MAQDGMFPKVAGILNKAHVPAWSLWIQGVWSAVLVLPRTVQPDGTYGNLYSNLLDWVISAALLFYVLAIAGVIRLRITRPDAPRPFKTPGYPIVPLLYIVSGIAILYCLFAYRASTTWPGLVIVLCGLPIYYLMKSSAKGTA
jgi:APA family basic amino acid/polyamine antiporter